VITDREIPLSFGERGVTDLQVATPLFCIPEFIQTTIIMLIITDLGEGKGFFMHGVCPRWQETAEALPNFAL